MRFVIEMKICLEEWDRTLILIRLLSSDKMCSAVTVIRMHRLSLFVTEWEKE